MKHVFVGGMWVHKVCLPFSQVQWQTSLTNTNTEKTEKAALSLLCAAGDDYSLEESIKL